MELREAVVLTAARGALLSAPQLKAITVAQETQYPISLEVGEAAPGRQAGTQPHQQEEMGGRDYLIISQG